MRGRSVLFLPRGNGMRITDEFRERTFGTIATETIAPPKPWHRPSHRFTLDMDIGGGIGCHEVFDDLGEAQAWAERFLRSYGQLD